MSPLPRSTPEAQGISSAAIHAYVDAVESTLDCLHSFILMRHGFVVAEGWWTPYRAADPHVLFSLSKSFTSTAIGLLIAEGKISLDDKVVSFFPDDLSDQPSEYLKAMRIHDLLSMSTGHTSEPFTVMDNYPNKTWVQIFLMHPIEHAPGTFFLYNSHATYMLSAIVQKITGERMLKYLQPRLFKPLGIQKPTWERSPQGIDAGGWGLSITTEDIAKFGQLYLQKGKWQGKQLIPESWIDTATSFKIANGTDPNNDWNQGYCYQFWRCRHNAYRGDGAFGQYCIVMPDQDAVLAITAGMNDMQPPLNLVWEHLLAAMKPDPLPADPQAHAELSAKLSSLELRTVHADLSSATAARVSGQVFKLDKNPDRIKSIRFDFNTDETTLIIDRTQGEQRIVCGSDVWARSEARFPPFDGSMRHGIPSDFRPWKIAASGAWMDADTYTIKLWWTETPLALVLICKFNGDRVTVEQHGNVGFTALQGVTLTGQRL